MILGRVGILISFARRQRCRGTHAIQTHPMSSAVSVKPLPSLDIKHFNNPAFNLPLVPQTYSQAPRHEHMKLRGRPLRVRLFGSISVQLAETERRGPQLYYQKHLITCCSWKLFRLAMINWNSFIHLNPVKIFSFRINSFSMCTHKSNNKSICGITLPKNCYLEGVTALESIFSSFIKGKT